MGLCPDADIDPKFVKDGVMNERSRKISVMSWRCESLGYRESNNPLELLFSLK